MGSRAKCLSEKKPEIRILCPNCDEIFVAALARNNEIALRANINLIPKLDPPKAQRQLVEPALRHSSSLKH
jgi:hypothetical protein